MKTEYTAKEHPTLEVGDVVDLRTIWGSYFAAPHPHEDRKGVIVLVNSESRRMWDYQVYWFSGNSYLFFEDDLMRCTGLEKKCRCRKCEDGDLCRHLPAIVRCDISEFGKLWSAGKSNPDVCEERNCEHRFVCGSERFIPK